MHLLATKPGTIADGATAVDLAQSPAEIVFLSAADSEIACLAAAQRQLVGAMSDWPSLRLANLMRLGHNYSVDLYAERVIAHAKLVIARILGGRGYWPYGDDRPDPDLAASGSVPDEAAQRLWHYLAEGGPGNAEHCLRYAAALIGRSDS